MGKKTLIDTLVVGAGQAGHDGQQHVLLGGGLAHGVGSGLVGRPLPLLVEDRPDARELVGSAVPGVDHGGAQVHGLAQLLALDPAGEAGVPLQLESREEGEVVDEGRRDAVDVSGQHAVAALVGRGDHVAEHVPATVEGRPGHWAGPFSGSGPLVGPGRSHTVSTYPQYVNVPTVCQRIRP